LTIVGPAKYLFILFIYFFFFMALGLLKPCGA